MHRGWVDESIDVTKEEAEVVIKAVIFGRSQAETDSLIGQYI